MTYILEQFCILVEDVHEEGEPVITNPYLKPTNVGIYRILENLIAIFPGLSNVVKKGLDKTRAMFTFSKLSMKELKDPNYEIPAIGGEIGSNLPPTHKKNDSKSIHSVSRVSKRSGGVKSVDSDSKSNLDSTFRENPVKRRNPS